jgi:hypothetical protein
MCDSQELALAPLLRLDRVTLVEVAPMSTISVDAAVADTESRLGSGGGGAGAVTAAASVSRARTSGTPGSGALLTPTPRVKNGTRYRLSIPLNPRSGLPLAAAAGCSSMTVGRLKEECQ